MKYILTFLLSLITLCILSQELPKWEDGYLDIHHINTGKGDCTFCILPDGTTMLIDAGENGRSGERVVSPRPDGTRSSGEWFVDYIRYFIPAGKEYIDYYLLTHYHSDHIGGNFLSEKKVGSYYLTGVSEVYQFLPAKVIVDRGHEYMLPSREDSCYLNYCNFLNSLPSSTKRETFSVGTDKQFVLRYSPEKYPSFFVRNIYADGQICNGESAMTSLFPKETDFEKRELPRENMYSCVIKLKYGLFDYYTGGDIPGYPRPGRPAWHDIETPVSKVVGKVEVAVLNHHGNEDGTNEQFLRNLSPQNIIMSTWDALHPNHTVLYRLFSKEIYPDERNIFSTNLHPAAKIVIGDLVDKIVSNQGHILVRVYPKGDAYRIYVFDDTVPVSESHVIYKSDLFKCIN